MFQGMATLPHAFLEPFVQLQIIKLWDYFVLLPDEGYKNKVSFVWPTRWNLSKCLFFANRYLAFIDQPMAIYVLMFADDAKVCENTFQALGCCVIRFNVYAQGSSCYALTLFGEAKGTGLSSDFSQCILYLSGVRSTAVSLLGMKGCTLLFENRDARISFVLLIAIESTLVILLAYKAVQYCELIIHTTKLLDLIASYIATSITNLVVIIVAPSSRDTFRKLENSLQRVLHSVLCSRILLHIRAVYQTQTVNGKDSIRITDISPHLRTLNKYETETIGSKFDDLEVPPSTIV
ncbi:hypothetical protein BD410DRAFT_803600 [Rickenella mellea]|uniref:DUF6533 domain-containing protein n=1 Tax=Rickenella mellea TaxID=50990 RepID=A0A4Y7Q5I5_9AGAM|nr:hypothetical protein BD410DRAFT_803600 [Rickenella mellea]